MRWRDSIFRDRSEARSAKHSLAFGTWTGTGQSGQAKAQRNGHQTDIKRTSSSSSAHVFAFASASAFASTPMKGMKGQESEAKRNVYFLMYIYTYLPPSLPSSNRSRSIHLDKICLHPNYSSGRGESKEGKQKNGKSCQRDSLSLLYFLSLRFPTAHSPRPRAPTDPILSHYSRTFCIPHSNPTIIFDSILFYSTTILILLLLGINS